MKYKKDTGFVDHYYDMKLPVYIGQHLYTNISVSGSYMRKADKPYELKVTFIGLNSDPDMGYGIFSVQYMNDRQTQYQFYFSDTMKKVFYNKEDCCDNRR